MEEEDAEAAVAELSGGYGADVVLECSGHPSGAALSLKLVRKQGKYTQVGLFGAPVEFDLEAVAVKELRFTGSFGQQPTSWSRALQLMRTGKVDAEALISHQLPLAEWREAFDLFERQEGVKLLLGRARGNDGSRRRNLPLAAIARIHLRSNFIHRLA